MNVSNSVFYKSLRTVLLFGPTFLRTTPVLCRVGSLDIALEVMNGLLM